MAFKPVYRNMSKNQRRLYWFFYAQLLCEGVVNINPRGVQNSGIKDNGRKDKTWEIFKLAVKDKYNNVIRTK